jgi:putative ABC transport system ATP-binding protein
MINVRVRRAPAVEAAAQQTPAALTAAASAKRPAVIDLRRISKVYGVGDVEVHALRNVTLGIDRGDFVAVMGASGSGKSTLMNLIGCLDVATAGRYRLAGTDVGRLTDDELATIRNRRIGFIFQSFNLIPRTSALSNVELPLVYAGVKRTERRARAIAALERVGLGDRIHHMPNQLSGGQQQRVAIARAIVTNPAIILADEPTGALDSTSTAEVLEIFEQLNIERRTVVVITHEDDVASRAKRIIRFRDGEIISDTRRAPVRGLPPAVAAHANFGERSLA